LFNSVAAIFLIQADISDGGNTVEEEKILRTCEKLLTTTRRINMSAHDSFNTGTKVKTGIRYLQAKSYVPISIIVVLLKHIRHPLQADARLHKQIEAHGLFIPPVIRLEQELHKLWRQSVPECDKRLAELGVGDIAGAIDVKLIKKVAPRSEKPPQSAIFVSNSLISSHSTSQKYTKSKEAERGENGKQRTVPKLIKVNRATPIRIKHANHHAHGMWIELAPVAIDQGILQLGLTELTTIVAVNGLEQRP
jgi:hypothetical protein